MARSRSGLEQSSLMTQTHRSWVWARSESSWAVRRSSGGSYVAMLIATSGPSPRRAAGGVRAGSGSAAIATSASFAPSTVPSCRRASSAMRQLPRSAGPSRAIPQKPLR
jgi:hypothetical protein